MYFYLFLDQTSEIGFTTATTQPCLSFNFVSFFLCLIQLCFFVWLSFVSLFDLTLFLCFSCPVFKFDTVHFQQLLFCLYICCPCLFNQSFICSVSVIRHLPQKLFLAKVDMYPSKQNILRSVVSVEEQVRSKSALKFKKSKHLQIARRRSLGQQQSFAFAGSIWGRAVQGHNKWITIISFCIFICNLENPNHFQNKQTNRDSKKAFPNEEIVSLIFSATTCAILFPAPFNSFPLK